MTYIGLDLGSTYTKIALLDTQRVLKEKRQSTPARMESGSDRYEIDAELYFERLLELLQEYACEGAQGILLSTQMHGWVLTDADFHPLTPYVSWQDQIGAKHLEALSRVITPALMAPSGVPLKANLALSSLWGRMQEGFRFPQDARLCTLGGYLIGRLTGRHICHMTNAAPTGLADVQSACWNLPLVQQAGLGGLTLPEIAVNLQPVGKWNGIPVYPDLGDQQVCAAGAALTKDDCLHVSVGTAGLIGLLTEEWGAGKYENRPWLTPGCYLRTVSGLPGGRHVAALKEAIASVLPASVEQDAVWRLLTTLSDSHLPVRAPQEIQRIEAFYRGMAHSTREAANRMERHITCLSFSGGCAAKNPELRRMIANAFGAVSFDPQDHDVMLGFMAIAAQLEEYR